MPKNEGFDNHKSDVFLKNFLLRFFFCHDGIVLDYNANDTAALRAFYATIRAVFPLHQYMPTTRTTRIIHLFFFLFFHLYAP